jgi:hypothetical protein
MFPRRHTACQRAESAVSALRVGSQTDGPRGSEADRMRRDHGERPGHGAWELDNGSAEGNGSANDGMRAG